MTRGSVDDWVIGYILAIVYVLGSATSRGGEMVLTNENGPYVYANEKYYVGDLVERKEKGKRMVWHTLSPP